MSGLIQIVKDFLKRWWLLIAILVVIAVIVVRCVKRASPVKLDPKAYDRSVDSLQHLLIQKTREAAVANTRSDSLLGKADQERRNRDTIITIYKTLDIKIQQMNSVESVDQLTQYLNDEQIPTGK
jgi:hypothetical protein